MEITLMNRTNENILSWYEMFRRIARNAEKVLDLDDDLEISVTFVRSVTIRKINREYRGIDRATDVISFAVRDAESFIEEEDTDLGDIFININYAKKQAIEYGHSYEREIGFLFAHGLLHCLGYDHMTEKDEKIMTDLQHKILDPIVPRV